MAPLAYIAHQVRNRVRLKIPEMRHDLDYFSALVEKLGALAGVLEVTANPATGSVIIVHPAVSFTELEPLLEHAGLFTLAPAPEHPQENVVAPVLKSFNRINETLSEGSAGNFNLQSFAFVGLVALAAHQAYRGNILAPAISLLWNAFDLAQRMSREKPGADIEPPT